MQNATYQTEFHSTVKNITSVEYAVHSQCIKVCVYYNYEYKIVFINMLIGNKFEEIIYS